MEGGRTNNRWWVGLGGDWVSGNWKLESNWKRRRRFVLISLLSSPTPLAPAPDFAFAFAFTTHAFYASFWFPSWATHPCPCLCLCHVKLWATLSLLSYPLKIVCTACLSHSHIFPALWDEYIYNCLLCPDEYAAIQQQCRLIKDIMISICNVQYKQASKLFSFFGKM